MPITRRLLAALGATAMTLFIALAPASPATASAYECRNPTYIANGWNVDVCLYADGVSEFQADGFMNSHPSACSYWRVYLVNNLNELVKSTGPLSCSTVWGTTIADVGQWYFPNGVAKARVKAWNSSNTVILSIDSPWLHYACC